MKIVMLESSGGEKAHIGPFDTTEDAYAYAMNKFGTMKNLWWVVDVQPPGSLTINLVAFTRRGK